MHRIQPPHGWPIPDAAQPVQPVHSNGVGRDHGVWHGVRHCHAPHRSECRCAARDKLRRDGDDANASPAPRARLRARQPGDLGRHPRSRVNHRHADRCVPRLDDRLSHHPGLYRHAGRFSRLAQRRLVPHKRSDHRATRQPLHGFWWHQRHARHDLELGHRHRRVCCGACHSVAQPPRQTRSPRC